MILGLAAAGGEVSGAFARMLWKSISRQGRLAQTLHRLQRAGIIDIHGTGPLDERIIRLTTAGNSQARAWISPAELWARRWDGSWRIVAFDIPETDAALRVRLRRKLHEYRFGWLQNSVWISPDPIEDFHAKLGEKLLLPESLTVFEAHPVGGESHESIVKSAWDFSALDKAFSHYFDLLRLRPNRLQGPAVWLSWLDTEHCAWREIVRLDPFLPAPLHPKGYRGRAAWSARMEALAAFPTALS